MQLEKDVMRCQRVEQSTVKGNEWGRKSYMDELNMDDAQEVLRTRLHMMPLPCNYGKSEGCLLCSTTTKITTEHYLECKGTQYLRRKWVFLKNKNMDGHDKNR